MAPAKPRRHSVSRGTGQRVAQNADFKVLVWYRNSDPLGTFKYQIYDVRKGEYTPKVDEWIKDVKTKYPGYYVVVRDVDLKREKGETELLKVGSVIYRELPCAAGVAGIAIGSRTARPRRAQSSDSVRDRRTQVPTELRVSTGRPARPAAIEAISRPAPRFPVPVPFPTSSSMNSERSGGLRPPVACGSLLHAFGFGGVVSLAAVMTGAGVVLAVGGLEAPLPVVCRRRAARFHGLLDRLHRLLGDLLGELAQVRSAGLIDELEAGFLGHEHVEQEPEHAVARERPDVGRARRSSCRSRRHRPR